MLLAEVVRPAVATTALKPAIAWPRVTAIRQRDGASECNGRSNYDIGREYKCMTPHVSLRGLLSQPPAVSFVPNLLVNARYLRRRKAEARGRRPEGRHWQSQTAGELQLMQVDSVASPEMPGFEELGISPLSIEEILPEILWDPVFAQRLRATGIRDRPIAFRSPWQKRLR